MIKAHGCLNKAPQLLHIRAKTRSMRSRQLPEELRDRAAARHRSGLKTLMLRLSSIDPVWRGRKFQTTTAAAQHQNWALWQRGPMEDSPQGKTEKGYMDTPGLGQLQVSF